MRNIESTTERPIEFFREFFLNNGFQELKSDFVRMCSDEEKKYPKEVQLFETDIDFIKRRLVPDGYGGEMEFTNTLVDEIENHFIYQIKKSKGLIDEAILQYLDKYNDADKFLKFQERKLQEIIQVSENFFTIYPFSKPILEDLLDYIKKSLLGRVDVSGRKQIIQQETPNQINEEDDAVIQYSYFSGNSNITRRTIKSIYTSLCENGIIAELEDADLGEAKFIEIFSSLKPQELNYKIRFLVNNIEIRMVIDNLLTFFKNLSPTTIENSKCFLNKSMKLLNRNDLGVAKSKQNQNSRISPDILSFLKDLKNISHLST